ncbi:MAG: 23S rRNA (guanosine(2251)-2'-O)-methyltransferase RlmB [Prevotella sp.]|nr:23S rRNA (guanosine(2251)-2'-O)-methyltransferase RlmB [Prevotella sp.]
MADYDRKNNPAKKPSARYEKQKSGNDDCETCGAEIIAGRNPVTEALKAGKSLNAVYVCGEGGSLGLICRMAAERGIPVKKTTEAKLNEMTGGLSHQGVAASGACAEYVTVEDILAVSAAKGTKPFIIICDEIEDPHNLGAVIRTAEAAGADGIIIPKRRSASLNGTVYKTSAGAASRLPAARVTNISAALDMLKKNGVWIYGTDASGEDYTKADFCGSIGLVIGSEGHGLGRLVREKCDLTLSLPMLGEINSLNASVAAGIFMYEAVRQRRLNV